MNEQKNLLIHLGEALERHRAERRTKVRPEGNDTRRDWPQWLGRHMIPNIGTVLVVFVLLITVPTLAAPRNATQATSTSVISYQGRLADSTGNPLTGYYNLEFRIYNVPMGGVPLWEEFWTGGNAVQVSDGLFHVMLGSLSPDLATGLAGQDTVYLGITVGTDSEMVPRVQLGSVPYAMYAAQADVPDGSITTAKLADLAVTTEKIADSAIATQKIVDDAVNAQKIDGDSVWGTSGTPLLNFIPMPSKGDPVLDLQNIGTIDYTNLDLTDATSSSAVAVFLQVGCSDTQSATSGIKCLLRKNGETSPCVTVKGHHINGSANVEQVVCAVDTEQVLQYRMLASGSDTAGLTLWVLGYWEPAALP